MMEQHHSQTSSIFELAAVLAAAVRSTRNTASIRALFSISMSPAAIGRSICGRAPWPFLLGVTARFVQNRTLSRLGLEHKSNVSQGPVDILGFWSRPDIIAGEADVLPSQGRYMSEKVIRNIDSLGAQLLHGAIKVNCVP